MTKKRNDYKVGYGKPPKHSQFPPGVSGNKGRRKRPETPSEIVARIRDEKIKVGDRYVGRFELMIIQVFNQAMRSAKARDLKLLIELLEKYGALPEADRLAETQAAADAVMDKIFTIFDRTVPDDPDDVT